MITNEIGLNAGKIWIFLEQNGDQPVKDMMKKLKLSTADFHMAVGWLAREGKIYQFEQEGVMMIVLK